MLYCYHVDNFLEKRISSRIIITPTPVGSFLNFLDLTYAIGKWEMSVALNRLQNIQQNRIHIRRRRPIRLFLGGAFTI